jgi:hypothetical protein
MAFANTMPDTGRSSYVRVTTGARPVSMHLCVDAVHVRQLAEDIACGVVSGARVPHMLHQLASRLESLEATASALEDAAALAMGRAG